MSLLNAMIKPIKLAPLRKAVCGRMRCVCVCARVRYPAGKLSAEKVSQLIGSGTREKRVHETVGESNRGNSNQRKKTQKALAYILPELLQICRRVFLIEIATDIAGSTGFVRIKRDTFFLLAKPDVIM